MFAAYDYRNLTFKQRNYTIFSASFSPPPSFTYLKLCLFYHCSLPHLTLPHPQYFSVIMEFNATAVLIHLIAGSPHPRATVSGYVLQR